MAQVPYGLGEWPVNNRGSHRAVVERDTSSWLKGHYEKKDVVWAHIEWRRRDQHPEAKAVIVYDAQTDQRITNVVAIEINQIYGDIIFQPSKESHRYYVYYLPWSLDGGCGDPFKPEKFTAYVKPGNTADKAWLQGIGFSDAESFKTKLTTLPRADVVEIQARTEFDRFDPMEVIATPAEIETLVARNPNRSYLLFTEDRKNAIRMSETIPQCWVKRKYPEVLEGEAQPGEIYPFQIGVYAVRDDVKNLKLKFRDLVGKKQKIAAKDIHCINLGGNDYLGRPFKNEINVGKGVVRPLWCWVEFPKNAQGLYTGSVVISAEGMESHTVAIKINVSGEVLMDGGVSDAWRLSKLKWLDSKLGIDDQVPAPFTPVELEGEKVRIWNRETTINRQGLPASMTSGGIEVLAAPIELIVQQEDRAVPFEPVASKIIRQNDSNVTKEYRLNSTDGNIALTTHWSTEFDGCTDYEFTLKASQESVSLSDVSLKIPVNKAVAKYMIGMRRMGSSAPDQWSWKWNVNKLDNYAWVGDVRAGLYFKLMHEMHNAPYDSFREFGFPKSWHNGGQGRCEFRMTNNAFVIRAFSGPRTLPAGEPVVFKTRFYVTPVKPIDLKRAFGIRQGVNWDPDDPSTCIGNVGHIHHAKVINPYINYPFLRLDALKSLTQLKPSYWFNLYYTIRELTNHLPEIWALRSLGEEVYSANTIVYTHTLFEARGQQREPVGHHWLREHLVGGYVTAWTQPLDGLDVDAAIGTNGNSRWNNFYIEGVNFLMKQCGIDGIYVDGIGYDRDTMKRLYKVMRRANPDSRINFHGGNCNHDSIEEGWGHVMPMHIEHLPYLSNLWMGEGFNYEQSPDYWLTEVSGLPFGQTSEMLGAKANAYRGMIYAMDARGIGDTRFIWTFWDSFGIQDARMIGYWDETCPVRTDNPDVKATVYAKQDKSLVVLASWAKAPVKVKLTIDWKALGMNPATGRLTAEKIPGCQDEASFSPTDAISIPPNGGWLLILK